MKMTPTYGRCCNQIRKQMCCASQIRMVPSQDLSPIGRVGYGTALVGYVPVEDVRMEDGKG